MSGIAVVLAVILILLSVVGIVLVARADWQMRKKVIERIKARGPCAVVTLGGTPTGTDRAEIIEAVRQAVQALDQEQKAVARHFLVTLLAKLEKRR